MRMPREKHRAEEREPTLERAAGGEVGSGVTGRVYAGHCEDRALEPSEVGAVLRSE